MAKLYGVYRSRATRNLWLAAEMGLDLDLVPVTQAYRLPDPAAPGAPLHTRSPAFLALSPAGAIPVLEDEGLVLSESLAINLYLARKHGGPLAPADLREEAQMLQWALYGATAVEPQAIVILYAAMEGRREGTDIDAAVAALQRPLGVIEGHLAAQGHPVGGRFTVADINLAEILRYGQARADLLAGFPATAAWLAACQARPAFRAMWARREAEPA